MLTFVLRVTSYSIIIRQGIQVKPSAWATSVEIIWISVHIQCSYIYLITYTAYRGGWGGWSTCHHGMNMLTDISFYLFANISSTLYLVLWHRRAIHFATYALYNSVTYLLTCIDRRIKNVKICEPWLWVTITLKINECPVRAVVTYL